MQASFGRPVSFLALFFWRVPGGLRCCFGFFDACRVAGPGLAPRDRSGALRAGLRLRSSRPHIRAPFESARPAPKVAATRPRHPSRCIGLCLGRRRGGLGAWPFSVAFAAAEIGVAPSRPRAPAARARTFGVVAVPGCLRSTDGQGPTAPVKGPKVRTFTSCVG